MICPNCGENNSANFRYCGMCGTSLETRRPAGAPRTVSTEAPRAAQPEREAVATRTTSRAAVHDVPPTSGPSFLGLNQPLADEARHESFQSSGNEPFTGLDSFFEPEDSGVSFRGVFVLLVLLGALGAGGWWAYTHYNGLRPSATSQAAAQKPAPEPSATDTASSNPAPTPAEPQASSPNSSPSASAAPSQPAPAPAESAKSTPPPAVEPKSDNNTPAKPAEQSTERAPRNQKVTRANAKAAARPSPAIASSGDNGESEFKRGEAFLYGRGVPENCNEAIRNLQAASAKQNAKARSTFGSMYATGHCVNRNLPTAYSWFAQALHADPTNKILEKDLTAVWNQMTPPERQIAARTKP